jgi:DNA-binding transcriptional LysR family regulator
VDDDITSFTRKMAGREMAPAGELRVTTNDSLLVHLLTPLFVKFRKGNPDMRLDVVLANQELNLSKRDADVAIRATDNPPENLVGRRAASIAWALYGRADEFPDPESVDPESLYERDWVSLGENLATLKAVKFVHEHVPPERIGYRVNTVLGLVRLGERVPEFSAGLWFLTHPDLRQSPRVRVFLDFLADEIASRRKLIEGQTPAIRLTSRADS